MSVYYYTSEDDLYMAISCEVQKQVAKWESDRDKEIKELTQKNEWLQQNLQEMLERERRRLKQHAKSAETEAFKKFADFLIGKSQNGVIFTCDLEDYVLEIITKPESEENNNA